MKAKKINTKTLARIASVQALYLHMFEGIPVDISKHQVLGFYKNGDVDPSDMNGLDVVLKIHEALFESLIQLATENTTELDALIIKYLLDDWEISDIQPLLLALLRVAVSELKYCTNTPQKVVINEFTNIASEMLASSKEIGFVNSILDKIAANITTN